MTSSASEAAASVRLDKWLWFARFCKSRSLAQSRIEAGEVAVNGVAARKSSQMVRPGDLVDLAAPGAGRKIRVLAAGERRGPAPEARTLYEECGPSEFFQAEAEEVPATHGVVPGLRLW